MKCMKTERSVCISSFHKKKTHLRRECATPRKAERGRETRPICASLACNVPMFFLSIVYDDIVFPRSLLLCLFLGQIKNKSRIFPISIFIQFSLECNLHKISPVLQSDVRHAQSLLRNFWLDVSMDSSHCLSSSG